MQEVIEPNPTVITPPITTEVLPTEDKTLQAEKFKNQGNQLLTSKDLVRAIECYTKAIELNPQNAVYYASRAAAFSQMGLHEKAIEDCNTSINLNPTYSKAYGRLGLAYFSTGKYFEAVDAYKKGLELEPNSASLKESLIAAQKKVLNPSAQASLPNQSRPNLPDMFNNPDLLNSMRGMLGNQGIPGILNNPTFQRLAQEMMNNPQMMNMANDLMQNPDAVNSMMNTFGIQPDQIKKDDDPNQ